MRKIALGFAAMLSLAASGSFLRGGYASEGSSNASRASAGVGTGAYIGANIGYSWGRSRDTETILERHRHASRPHHSFRDHMNGVVGGGQIGYNWQANNIV